MKEANLTGKKEQNLHSLVNNSHYFVFIYRTSLGLGYEEAKFNYL